MTLKPEVLVAIERIWRNDARTEDSHIVKEELLAMDAEIDRLNHLWEMMTNLAVKQKREIESLKEEQAMHNSAREAGE